MVPEQNMLPLTLCVSGLALVAGHKLDGAQFGSKSSYFTVGNFDDSSLQNYGGCEPKMMWMYVRHGSRNPDAEEILDMTNLLPVLRDEIIVASDMGKGGLSADEVQDLREWTFELNVEDEDLLTNSGHLEGMEIGKRWKTRFSNFFGDQSRVQSWTSDKQRAIETGKSFLQGLELDSEDIVVDNSKATYYKGEYGCEKYVNEVYENDNVTHAEAIKFTQSQAWADMIEDVRERTGVEMTPELTELAHKMCKYQLAWEPERYTDFISRTADFPPWCNIFSKKDTTLFEFDFDLEAFYESGPAFEITTMATHKVIKDLYGLIDSHTSAGQTPEASAVFTFGHSGGLGPLINAFEIYRDEGNLTASDWGTDKAQQRKWRISDIGTFASNIGVILYHCNNGSESKVMLVHNEHVVEEQPACGETLCSVEDFKARYQHIVHFDWDKECPVDDGQQ